MAASAASWGCLCLVDPSRARLCFSRVSAAVSRSQSASRHGTLCRGTGSLRGARRVHKYQIPKCSMGATLARGAGADPAQTRLRSFSPQGAGMRLQRTAWARGNVGRAGNVARPAVRDVRWDVRVRAGVRSALPRPHNGRARRRGVQAGCGHRAPEVCRRACLRAFAASLSLCVRRTRVLAYFGGSPAPAGVAARIGGNAQSAALGQ